MGRLLINLAMKKVTTLILILFLVSCNYFEKPKKIEPSQSKSKTDKTIIEKTEKKLTFILETILLPSSYRVDKKDDPTKQLNNNWFDLYEENDSYFLGTPSFSIKKSYDECVGMDVKTIESKRKTILYIDNKNLKIGKIEFLKTNKNQIWPKEEMKFIFNNKTYILEGQGTILTTENRTNEDDTNYIWHNVSDYKLILKSEDGTIETLINESSFDQTFVDLLFIGDIDQDGKPDFIFEAPTNYEQERVILILSSEAKKVPRKREISINFDC